MIFSYYLVIKLRLLARQTWLSEDKTLPHMNKLLAHVPR